MMEPVEHKHSKSSPQAMKFTAQKDVRIAPNSYVVCRFPPWYAFSPVEPAFFFPNSAQAEFGGFGLGRLERNGFLCAKAPLHSGFA